MLKVDKYQPTNGVCIPCAHCRILQLCSQYVNEDGSLKSNYKGMYRHQSSQTQIYLDNAIYCAVTCKKHYPNYIVRNESGTQHVLVNKWGSKIYTSDSGTGFIVGMLGITLIAVLICMLLALICSIFGG